jgi:hypothetical protein
VVNERTAKGGRLNATEDLCRLRLFEQLVDSGNSIGAVATVSLLAVPNNHADREDVERQVHALSLSVKIFFGVANCCSSGDSRCFSALRYSASLKGVRFSQQR